MLAVRQYRMQKSLPPWSIAPLLAVSILTASCSASGVHDKLEPTARAVQPTVNAVKCGGRSVKEAIRSCHAEGGTYGHCAVSASRVGASDATACYNYAELVRRRREELVGQENDLDAQSNYLKDLNLDTQKLNDDLSARVSDVTARTDVAKESLARGEMTESDLAQLHDILDIELSSAQQQVDTVAQELRSVEQYRERQSTPAPVLDGEITQLRRMLQDARQKSKELAEQSARLNSG